MSLESKRCIVFLAALTVYAGRSQGGWTKPGLAAARADQLIPNESYRLTNGMKVILHEDHRTPFIAVHVTYHYGPLYEQASSRGISHLVEHLFQGRTVHMKRSSPSSQLRQLGGVQIRMRLEPDRMDSWSVVPSANLARALWAESDRMGFMLPAVDDEDIADIKKVIAHEDRLRLSTVPYVVGDEQLSAALIPIGQPVHGNWRGIVPSVHKTSEIESTVRCFYSPANATLVLAGDFARSEAFALIEKYFGTLKSPPPPVVPQVARPVIVHQVVLQQADAIARRPRLRLGWLTPELRDPGSTAAAIVELLLSRGTSGRLHQELVRNSRLALDVSAGQLVTAPQSEFFITAYAEQESALLPIQKGIDAVLDKLASTEVSAEELTAVKRHYTTLRLLQLADIHKKAQLLQTYDHYLGTPDGMEQELARIEQLRAADVQKFVRDYLRPDRRVALYSTGAQTVVISGDKP